MLSDATDLFGSGALGAQDVLAVSSRGSSVAGGIMGDSEPGPRPGCSGASHCSDGIPAQLVEPVMRLVVGGTGEDEDTLEDEDLTVFAVSALLNDGAVRDSVGADRMWLSGGVAAGGGVTRARGR